MKYRTLQKTHITSSILGYGIMRMPSMKDDPDKIDENKAIELIQYAYSKGITYFDTAQNYMKQRSEHLLGEATKDFRDKIIIATKVGIWHVKESIKDVEELIDSQLKRLKTPYIDFYMIHALTDLRWKTFERIGIIRLFEQMKRDGMIRHYGFSYHGTPFFFEQIIAAYDWEFVQLQVNYIDTDMQATIHGLTCAREHGVDTIIMEPLRGGQLVHELPDEVKELFSYHFPRQTYAEIGLNWLLNREDIDIILSGMNATTQIDENVSVVNASQPHMLTAEANRVYETAKEIFQRKTKVRCTQCRYCLPCPQEIYIPRVFNAYNFAFTTSFRGGQQRYLRFFAEKVRQCNQCGDCVSKCPQSLEIPRLLSELDRVFTK